jgi:CO/xanthine dehydrogenase Mo-binding subunit
MTTAALPASLARNPRLGQWLRFRRDGIVEVHSGKVEIGQGILTALAQIVADELGVDASRVRMMRACTAYSPDEGVTSGSLSMQHSGEALRHVCREARAIYLDAAARSLGVEASALRVRAGEIHAGDRRTSYAELANDGLLDRDASMGTLASFAEATERVGATAPRLDLPDKVMGRPRFVHDVLPKGTLHGRVLRPPSPGAKL